MTPSESVPAQPTEAKLVTSGPYRLLRHPTYLGYLVMFTGFQVFAWSPLILLSIPLWLTFRRWIRTEEKNLLKQWGDKYVCYCRRSVRGL